jgi:hypothetical protein
MRNVARGSRAILSFGLVTVLTLAIGSSQASQAKSKRRRPSTTTTLPSRTGGATDKQLDTWWGGLLSDSLYIGPKRTFPMEADKQGCVGATFRPAITAERRKAIKQNPDITITELEAARLVQAVDNCGVTIPLLTFAYAQFRHLPATDECYRQEWIARPEYARAVVSTFVLLQQIQPSNELRAADEAVHNKCTTPEETENQRTKGPDPETFKPVTNTLP